MKDVLNKPVIRFLALLALLSFPPCKALGDSLNDAEAAGLAALAQRDFQKAYASFQQALLEARKMQDKTRIADQLFYLGLSLQRSIAPNEGVQSEKLAQAIGHYEGALRLRTNSAATLNN